ncbi:hypothetical protein RhiirA5_417645 [Rhizophagus irregularis]|uniref:Tyr recombinase domain-containing protein n=2 Tax=Rhizophagus irregularis TaxID=588596 RepID=A0A2I1F882_9GLOM|nr:hypothetical protein GLOIN_2v1780132 [Rhizophagus irregularis DAOM 181602=DAOM 197198]PKC07876.1 hypothetical protein RhiirA5_417645 [Rhizophagus irregularis]PKC71246.1 hypothetical protein RhiirA1_453751 [Rhizophagus irregularis]PKY30591.1 hypothetical protein RhiirB3_447754 [Rhizophagus irregularis]POG66826.1 hypothetical protein GLOIN_2v1780132 [Rhizophagus irregularis DAOM 181602=DAOM 197198]CAG8743459.1 7181_t:CDS:2 [Rhizophagus irregularis]|eukprot:XP_025173692.1 hypothetical protein GLOIN_2v1780132 [Rhizophagus irregularis DAOM 181602=DAOM 197198]
MFIEKNNQRGVRNRNKYGKSTSRKIPIPPDFEGNNYRPIFDILKYKSMRPSDACPSFFLETTRSKADLSIELSDGRKIVNHSCRRTAIQMLKDGDIPEDEIMEFSGHRSREGVRTYKSIDEARKIKNVVSLIPLDFEDIEVEEFEYFPGNSWENLNDNDDSDSEFSEQGNSHDREDLGEIEHNSSSSEVNSGKNSDEDCDLIQTDNKAKKRQILKDTDTDICNITQRKRKCEAQSEFSKIIIPDTVKDVHFHIHY